MPNNNPQTDTSGARLRPAEIIGALAYFLLLPAILLFTAGTLTWWQGWTFSIIVVLGMLLGRIMVWQVHPDMLAERAQAGRRSDIPEWDRRLVPLVGMIGPLIILFTAGLDYRFQWSPVLPLWLQLTGLLIILGGYALANWAFYTNQFFSSYVRIQQERNHHVINKGPYRWIRHPGYAGGLLAWLGTPLFLSTLWAYIPILGLCLLIIIRTQLEDRKLQAELPGYADYAAHTRYRLLPGVW